VLPLPNPGRQQFGACAGDLASQTIKPSAELCDQCLSSPALVSTDLVFSYRRGVYRGPWPLDRRDYYREELERKAAVGSRGPSVSRRTLSRPARRYWTRSSLGTRSPTQPHPQRSRRKHRSLRAGSKPERADRSHNASAAAAMPALAAKSDAADDARRPHTRDAATPDGPLRPWRMADRTGHLLARELGGALGNMAASRGFPVIVVRTGH
jgi:hypothetical protein